MIYVPNEVKVKIGIEQGCIYNFSPVNNVSNHYYLVLNKNPKQDSEIYLAPFTTKKEKVLKFIEFRKLDKATFVLLNEKECVFLPYKKEAGIDCNRLLHTEINTLIQLIDNSKGSCNYPKAEKTLLERVLIGVKASSMVSPNIKSFL